MIPFLIDAVRARSLEGTTCFDAVNTTLIGGRFVLRVGGGSLSISQADEAAFSAANNDAEVGVTGTIGFDCTG